MAELGSVLGGRYVLDQVLGQGGMATIFAATDTKLGRKVAVKVLRPEFGADAAFVERFGHEAQAAASLNHPNIVAVFDYGTDRAGPYIVMEQVAGGDLARVLGERGSLPPTAVARTGQQIADALTTAHARGLVHRDIKPANILLSPDGRVQVADFGIAQAAASPSITEQGVTLGSVLYFSPEQARGDSATPASDVYSLGLVMYEMVTGQRAFTGDSPAALAVARLAGGVPSPMSVRAEVPASLDAIVRWCLSTDPAARPSASELAAALARFMADPSGSAFYGTLAALGTAAVPGGVVLPPTSVLDSQLLEDQYEEPGESEHGGSGPWAWVAAGFGLLVIVASGVLLFLLFSGIGNEEPSPSPSPSSSPQIVATPRFEGRLEVRAERLAAEAGLLLEKDFQETSSDLAGRIIAQLPEPGVDIPVGTSVKVTVGTLAETVVVPDVRGLRPADAIRELEAAGLVEGLRQDVADSMTEGYVASTDPRAGVSTTRGSNVDYFVSTGAAGGVTPRPARTPRVTPRPARTPRVTPTPRPTRTPRPTATPTAPAGPTPSPTPTPPPIATPTITEGPGGGPTPAPTPTPSPSPPPTPAPTASPTPAPSPSPAPTPTPTPTQSPSPSPSPTPFPSAEVAVVGNFECLDLGTARSQIEAVGLLLGTIIPDEPARDDSWIVHDQLPAPGGWVPVGSAVDLVVMEPLEPCPGG